MNPINFQYGNCLVESNVSNRNFPTSQTYGQQDPINDKCLNKVNLAPGLYSYLDLKTIGEQNSDRVQKLDSYFFNQVSHYPKWSTQNFAEVTEYAGTDLQSKRPEQLMQNNYIQLASESLHVYPDTTMSVFFSDSNIAHLRRTIVEKVKEITTQSGVFGENQGVTLMEPNMDDFFSYMLNVYKNYKVYNGSICFIKLSNDGSVKGEIAKLNSNILQDYVSKLVSQINMYVYYYKDASQLPEQLSLPEYNSMKGSKTLEYNVGFKSGNSIGISSYSQVSNIL